MRGFRAWETVPRKWIAVLFLIFAIRHGLVAQAGGRISGAVVDEAGHPVSGAKVTLLLNGKPAVAALTSGRGLFFFPAVTPQVYDLAVVAARFERLTRLQIRVDPAAETSLGVLHLVSGDDSTVLANTNVQSLENDALDLAFSAPASMVDRLPISGRDALYLVYALPGVQENGRAPVALNGVPLANTEVNYAGASVPVSFLSGISPAFTLFGGVVDEVTASTGLISGCGCAQVSMSAPFGGSALRGSAYWFGTPAGVTAQNWTDSSTGTPASTTFNQLGADLGGPLRRRQLYFFANLERYADGSTVTRTGQTATAPLTSVDPAMRQVLSLLPQAPLGLYRGTQTNGQSAGSGLARLDFLPSTRNAFGLVYAQRQGSADDPSDSPVFGARPAVTSHMMSRLASVSWRWSITPMATNELHAGASYLGIDYRNSLRREFDFIAILDDPSLPVSQPMAAMDPLGTGDRRINIEDTFTRVSGKSHWQAGVSFLQYQLGDFGNNYGPLDSLTIPRYVVNNIAQGLVDGEDQRFNILSPSSGYSAGSTALGKTSAAMYGAYFQETLRLWPRLSITIGARYNLFSPAHQDAGAAIIPSLTGIAADAVFNKEMTFQYASHPSFYSLDTNNIVFLGGLAWKPSAKLPVEIRGGTGASYINDELLPDLNIFALRNPFQSFDVSTDLSAGPVPLSRAPVIPTPIMPALNVQSLYAFANSYNQEPGTVYGVDPNLRISNVRDWNLGVEAQGGGFDFDVRYLGNRLEEALRSTDHNQTMLLPNFAGPFGQVQAAVLAGAPTTGFPNMPGGGLCANFNLQSCVPDIYARSLIRTGQIGELGRWYEGQGYNPYGNYDFLGNPITPQGIDILSQVGISRYDALQLNLTRRAASGLILMASYVFSAVHSTLDDYQPGGVDPMLDDHNATLDWARAPFNITRAAKLAAAYDLVFLGNRLPARSAGGILLRGWSLSALAMAQSGAPFSLLSGGYVVEPNGQQQEITGLGTFNSLADSGQNTVSTALKGGQIDSFFGIRKGADGTVSYVNAPAGAFYEPLPATVGGLQRRMFTGPGAYNMNVGLRKSLAFGDRTRGEFRADVINILNRQNWLVGDQTYLGDSARGTAIFQGNVTEWSTPRSLQFLFRVLF